MRSETPDGRRRLRRANERQNCVEAVEGGLEIGEKYADVYVSDHMKNRVQVFQLRRRVARLTIRAPPPSNG